MSFGDKLGIDKIITKEPESIEEWLERFIEIIMKEKRINKRRPNKIVARGESNVQKNR